MSRSGLSALSATLASLMAVVHLLGFEQVTTVFSGVFLSIFIALEWPKLIVAARGLVITCAGLFAGFWLLDRASLELLGAAIDRAAFLFCFVVVLSFLRDAAQSSKLIQTSGRIIVNQSPGRRYLTLALGGHLMGVLMNLGAVTLLSTMVHGSIAQGDQSAQERVREIRLRRMTLAMLRGFSAVVFWAPTSVTVAIILSSSLQLCWVDLLPLGIPALLCFLALGWAVDRLTYPRARRGVAPIKAEPWLRPFGSLLGIILLVPVSGSLVSGVLDLSLLGGMFLCIPVIGLGWITVQNLEAGAFRALRIALNRTRHQTLPSLRELRNELTIFATSGFLAVILLPQIDVAWLSENIARFGLSEGVVLLLGSWAIIVLALLAVNPLVTASLVIETLVRLPDLDLDPAVIAFMVTATWGTTVAFSPFSTSVRLTARGIHRNAAQVGPKWNLIFSICAVLLIDAVLLLFV